MSVTRVPMTRKMKDPEDQRVADALAREIEETRTYGTSAPTSSTPGKIYYKHGSATTDSVTVYVKVNGVWYGG